MLLIREKAAPLLAVEHRHVGLEVAAGAKDATRRVARVIDCTFARALHNPQQDHLPENHPLQSTPGG